MSDHVPPIARIRLSRSLPRLLALPAVGVLIGVGVTAGALLLLLPGLPGVGLAGIGGLMALLAAMRALVLLSIHVVVEESAVRLTWLGGERVYVLSPGPVTRVRLRGEGASALRTRMGWAGWQLGGARLRDEEDIEVVRLAPTATAILVPTEQGRLAIAARDEDELIAALSSAARARQRLEAFARDAPPARVAAPPEPVPESAPAQPDPPMMTGIERALFAQRLADELAVAESAAEAERIADEAPAQAASDAQILDAAAAQPSAASTSPLRSRRWVRIALPRLRIGRPAPGPFLVLLPLVGAGLAWGIGLFVGDMPAAGSDLGRLTALALVLAGPATTIGAIMARAWWPRLVGLVVAGGLAASVFIGRVLFGPVN